MRIRSGFVWLLLLMTAHLIALPRGADAAAQASVRVLRPEPESTVQGPNVTVEVEVDGVVLGGRERNGAYALLTLDDLPPVKSFSRRFTFRGVEPDSHVLVVELRRPDGTSFEPEARARVQFTTRSGSGRGHTGRMH